MKINFINIIRNFNIFYVKYILKKRLSFLFFRNEIFSKLNYLIINSNNKMLLKLSYLKKIRIFIRKFVTKLLFNKIVYAI